MADKKPYSSILDEMLDEREPSWEDVGLADAKKSGEKQLNRTYQYVNKKFIDELAEGVSHHTQLPSDSKSATLLNRMAEKDAAAPRLGSGYLATTRLGSKPEDYRNPRGDDASLFDEVTMDLGKAEGTADIRKRNRTDSEIKGYVHKLLNQGTPPAHVAAQLRKLGELELLDKKDNMGASYLNQNAGLLGLAYLEPNTFMDKNSPAYEREKVGSEEKPFCAHCNKDVTPEKRDANSYCPECEKILTVKPKTGARELSVPERHQLAVARKTLTYSDAGAKIMGGPTKEEAREIILRLTGRPAKEASQKTSADCVRQHDAWKAAGITPRAKSVKKVAACEGCAYFKNRTCGLYRLPVVASAAELVPIVNRLTAGIPAEYKKAALVKIANRQPERAEGMAVTAAPARPIIKTAERTIESLRDSRQQASAAFDADAVGRLHKAGHGLEKIYRAGIRKAGSVQAGRAIKQFIASLKDRGTKVSLSQVDCRFLKAKLAMSNAIVGAIKCGDCAYRQDMHCGLTGGTLLSFPGMERTGKVASAPPEDAVALLNDYELTGQPKQGDIVLNEDRKDDVEMGSKPSAGNL